MIYMSDRNIQWRKFITDSIERIVITQRNNDDGHYYSLLQAPDQNWECVKIKIKPSNHNRDQSMKGCQLMLAALIVIWVQRFSEQESAVERSAEVRPAEVRPEEETSTEKWSSNTKSRARIKKEPF